MIKLINIEKKYDKVLFSELNYEFFAGNFYWLSGPSGSGKTTLINLITNTDPDYNGYIEFSEELDKNSYCYVFQESLLISHLTIFENLLFISNKKEKVLNVLKKYNLIDLKDKYPDQLSNGQRQRISLIRGLIKDPKLIIADEVTSALDKDTAKEILLFLKELATEGKIVILASHDPLIKEYANIKIAIENKTIKEHKNHLFTDDEIINNESNITDESHNNFSSLDNLYVKKRRKNIGTNIIKNSIVFSVLFVLIGFFGKIDINYFNYMAKNRNNTMFYINEKIPMDNNDAEWHTNRSVDNFDKGFLISLIPPKDINSTMTSLLNFGKYPEKNDEVIIDTQYLSHSNISKDEIFDHMIEYEGLKFKVVGVYDSDKQLDLSPYFSRRDNSEKPTVLTINSNVFEFENIDDEGFTVFLKKNLSLSEYSELEIKHQMFNALYSELNSSISSQRSIKIIFYCLIIVVFLVVFLFMYNNLSLELFYRKKELGYLLLFGVSVKRVYRIVIIEIIYKYWNALFLSLIIFFLSYICFSYLGFDILGFQVIYALVFLLVFFYVLGHLSVRKLLKKPIKMLIS